MSSTGCALHLVTHPSVLPEIYLSDFITQVHADLTVSIFNAVSNPESLAFQKQTPQTLFLFLKRY